MDLKLQAPESTKESLGSRIKAALKLVLMAALFFMLPTVALISSSQPPWFEAVGNLIILPLLLIPALLIVLLFDQFQGTLGQILSGVALPYLAWILSFVLVYSLGGNGHGINEYITGFAAELTILVAIASLLKGRYWLVLAIVVVMLSPWVIHEIKADMDYKALVQQRGY